MKEPIPVRALRNIISYLPTSLFTAMEGYNYNALVCLILPNKPGETNKKDLTSPFLSLLRCG